MLDDALAGKVRLKPEGWLHYGTLAGGKEYANELVSAVLLSDPKE